MHTNVGGNDRVWPKFASLCLYYFIGGRGWKLSLLSLHGKGYTLKLFFFGGGGESNFYGIEIDTITMECKDWKIFVVNRFRHILLNF